jgi:UDP-N-acetylglucosamine 2-epimerase (non-hydrolysing)/GDP/UDP-N,N'-diacetylbacillosamine 2-epimerase (hydrolysing)
MNNPRPSKRRLCVVTGSRADYGLLYWLMKDIAADPDLGLLVVATGTHLSPEFGLTYRVIEGDGFTLDAKVEMLLSGDSPAATAKSMGLGVIGFADAFERLAPDWVVLLGDRTETFAAAQAALIARIPIAHIAGGDTTEGSYDEALRHAITKMAQLHFVTNPDSERRVRQLGEDPRRIFNFGSPGVDYIRRLQRLSRAELERALDFRLRAHNLLVTFHPATLEAQPPSEQLSELLGALSRLDPASTGIIITKPNADTGGRALTGLIDDFVAAHANARAYASLGQDLYLSAMSHVDAVVGNSSSGIYEAPSLGKPSVNIGERQKGRLQADSVINCAPVAADIERALHEAMRRDCRETRSPYGDGEASRRILLEIKRIAEPAGLIKKQFFNLDPRA